MCRVIVDLEAWEDLLAVQQVAPDRAGVDHKEDGGEADEDEGEDDEVAKRLDVWQYNHQGELQHVHQHVQ